MGEGHLPVLVDEVLASLGVRSRQLHRGLHGRRRWARRAAFGGLVPAMAACSASMPIGRPSRRRHRVLAQYGDRVVAAPGQLRVDLRRGPVDSGFIPLDAVLFDLGLSSYQLADPIAGLQLRGRCAAGHEIR